MLRLFKYYRPADYSTLRIVYSRIRIVTVGMRLLIVKVVVTAGGKKYGKTQQE